MNSSSALHRGVVTALCADRVADRTIVTGLDHDFEAARIVAMLRAHGLEADVHIDTDHRSLSALAHGVAARGVDYVVAYAPRALPDGLLRGWLGALERARPGAVVCLHHGRPTHATEPAAIALAAADDHALLGLLGAAPADAQTSVDVPSPYLSRLVPPSAAPRVGIDVAGRAALVREELLLLDRRVSGEQRVVLRGIADHPADEQIGALLRALAATPLRRVRPLAQAEPGDLDDEAVVRALVQAGVGLRLIAHAGDGDELGDGLAVEAFIAAGLPVELHLVVDPSREVHVAAEAARTLAPGFTYEIAPGAHDPDDVLEAVRELGPGSATAATLAALEGEAGARLQYLLCGSREDPRGPAGAHALLWLGPESLHAQADWVRATTSLDAGVWACDGEASGAAVDGALSCQGDPSAGPALCLFGHDRELEVLPYADGRHTTPYGPLVLALTDAEDVRALLDDADEAWRSGTFPIAIGHPFTAIADGVAFAGPGSGGADVRRLIVQEGAVRTGLAALPIGRVGDSHATLAAHARAAQQAREARRGCAECPIASACSRDGSLERLLDDDAYCGMRRSRPWLGLYVALPALIRQVLRADAGIARGAERLELRVSGFGGALFYPDTGEDPPGAALAVIETRGRHFLADAASGRCARLTADLAAVADGLLASGSSARTEAWLASERDLSAEQARATVAQALELLDRARIGAGVRAVLADGSDAAVAGIGAGVRAVLADGPDAAVAGIGAVLADNAAAVAAS